VTTTDELAGLDPDGTILDQWDGWPTEPALAFGHFLAYRLAGRARTLRRTAEERQISHSYAMSLSAEWRWVSRSQAWDRHQAAQYAARLADRRLEMGEQHLAVANLLMAKAVEALRNLDPVKLNARDLALYIEQAAKLQRLVVGDSTERVEHVDVGPGEDDDLAAMDDEQLHAHLAGLRTEIDSRLT
jgi:hypothetical protein